jgi:hypothetical protein
MGVISVSQTRLYSQFSFEPKNELNWTIRNPVIMLHNYSPSGMYPGREERTGSCWLSALNFYPRALALAFALIGTRQIYLLTVAYTS